MREVEASTLRIIDDLHGDNMAALVYGPKATARPILRINRALLTGRGFDLVLSWARREIARGARLSWLLADELDDLA